MKKIPIFFIVVVTIMLLVVRCDDYDDSEVKADIAELQSRVSALEDYCSTLNSQITSLQSAVTAIESVKYVTDLTTLSEDGVVIGYTISFSDGTSFTIYNGTDGTDGTIGSTPVIGVVLVDGVYYWTLDGVPISDSDGNMIRASASDGESGIVPQLKIDDGYWYVSYDGGTSWSQLGEASAGDTEYITAVTSDDSYVYITLYDGTVLKISKQERLSIVLDMPSVGIEEAGETIEVGYTLTGYDSSTLVRTLAQDNYSASVTAYDSGSGVIKITAPGENVTASEIFVFVGNEETTIMKIISIKLGGVIVATSNTVTAGFSDIELAVTVGTNMEYTVSIPEDVEWISYTETKAMHLDTLKFTLEKNVEKDERYTIVTITAKEDTSIVETILVTQEALTPTINTSWSIDYYGKYEYSSTVYYDRIDYIDGDGTRYVPIVYSAEFIDAITIDSLFTYQQDLLDYYRENYDANYYDGYYVAKRTYTSGKTLYYEDLEDEGEYYSYMFGINDDCQLTGYYQTTGKFTPEVIEASDGYNAWLGTWDYTDSDGNSGTLTFSTKSSGISYYVTQNYKFGFPTFNAEYNSSDGTVTLISTNTGFTEDSDYGEYTAYWWGIASVNSSYYYVASTGIDVAVCTMDDGGSSATIEGCSVTTTYGSGTFVYMGYFLYISSTGDVYTWSYAPKIPLPVNITLSSSSSSVGTKFNDRTNMITNVTEQGTILSGTLAQREGISPVTSN